MQIIVNWKNVIMSLSLATYIYEKSQEYNMSLVKVVRILSIYNGIKLANPLSNSMVIKKYISLIISIIFLFSLFSSLFIPVLTAKNVLSESDDSNDKVKDTGVSSTPAVSVESVDVSDDKEKDKVKDTGVSSTPAVSVESVDVSDDKEKDKVKDTGVSSTPAVEKVSSTPAVSVESVDVSDDTEKDKVKDTGVSSTPAASIVSIDDNTSLSKGNDNEVVTKSFDLKKNETIEKNENETEEEIELTLESNIGNLTENDKISVEISEEDEPSTIIKKIDFSSSKNQQNVRLKVSNLKGEPAEIKNELNISTSSNVYKYFDIKLTSGDTYIGETGIRSMNFTFTINKSWIDNNNIDKYTVTMMRYHNDTWQELNTTYLNETDNKMTFKAITPGLSIFAVVGDKVVEDSDDIIVETTNVPWWMPATVIFASSATLGLVLFKKRFVYTP